MYIYIHICVYIYTHIYIYIYTHIYESSSPDLLWTGSLLRVRRLAEQIQKYTNDK